MYLFPQIICYFTGSYIIFEIIYSFNKKLWLPCFKQKPWFSGVCKFSVCWGAGVSSIINKQMLSTLDGDKRYQ